MSPVFACQKCSFTFESQWALNRHAATHNPPTIPCAECDKLFKRQFDLTRHVNSVHRAGTTPFVCDNDKGGCGEGGCGKTYTRLDALRRHQKKKR